MDIDSYWLTLYIRLVFSLRSHGPNRLHTINTPCFLTAITRTTQTANSECTTVSNMSSRDLLHRYSTLSSVVNVITNLTDLTTSPQTYQHGLQPWQGEDNLLSPQQRDLAILILRCGLQKIVLLFGIPGNTLNLAVFAKVMKHANMHPFA